MRRCFIWLLKRDSRPGSNCRRIALEVYIKIKSKAEDEAMERTPYQRFKKILNEYDNLPFELERKRTELKQKEIDLKKEITNISINHNISKGFVSVKEKTKELEGIREMLSYVSTMLESNLKMGEREKRSYMVKNFPEPQLKDEVLKHNAPLVEQLGYKLESKKKDIMELKEKLLEEIRELGQLEKEQGKLLKEINEVKIFFGDNVYYHAGATDLNINKDTRRGFIYMDEDIQKAYVGFLKSLPSQRSYQIAKDEEIFQVREEAKKEGEQEALRSTAKNFLQNP